MPSSDLVPEKFFDLRNTFKFDDVCTAYLSKKNNFQTKMSTSSSFELEPSFWCQKLRLDFLNLEQASEKISDVGNTVKIDLN
jgi:hypothetical protein